ncbi:hypothetical protein Sjap_004415 [Stephania japonica]|uniref:Uncharacterized protein n=1 Tax=Stephania japonica TaxID=461633 RepID=A0AAP0K4D3_9MAGN
MITHGIYSAVILGHGLWKIHDHKRRLRQRIQQLKSEGRYSMLYTNTKSPSALSARARGSLPGPQKVSVLLEGR